MALSDDSKVAFKIAHLNMIQGAIARMSGFSANAKTFTVTILAGLAAISLQSDKAQLGMIAMLATMILGVIDIYYMTLELRFRAFYEYVESRNLDHADDLAIKPLKRSGDVMRALNSTPAKLFYLPILGGCVLFIGYGLAHDWWTSPERHARSNPPRVEQPAESNTPTERAGQLVQPSTKQSAGAAQRPPRQPEPIDTWGAVRPETTASPAARQRSSCASSQARLLFVPSRGREPSESGSSVR